MKIGIRTASLGSIGSELPAALEAAARLGYDGLEVVTRDAAQLRGWLQMDGSEGAGTVRELARRHGCAITSFSLALFRPVSFAQEDESLRQQGIQLLSDTLRACANVGGETVLLPFFDRKRLDEIGAEELARFVDGLRRCARVAEDTAMRIALETSFSPALLQRILGAVGSERVGVYQDLANAITFGQDPAVALRALGPAVAMVHVKDTKAGGGDAMLGEGLVDWPECRAAIRDIGYDGWFVLETPPGDDPLATGARHLEFTRAGSPGRRAVGQAWYCTGVRTLLLRESPDPPLGSDQVRVRTLYSGISAGTELTYYRGTNSRLHRRWDARLRLFRDGGGEWDEPGASGRLLGYEEVGEVVELGPDVPAGGVGVGAVVRGAWGHRTTTVMTAAHAAAQRLPAGLHPRHAVLGYIGGVALNGILDASIRVTESVAIFGLGVVGQLVAQLARLSGARVVAIDPVAFRREVAAALGAAATIDPAAEGGLRVTRAREEIAPYRRVLGSGASS